MTPLWKKNILAESGYLLSVRLNRKIAVIGAPRPTLRFWADPTTFFLILTKKIKLVKLKKQQLIVINVKKSTEIAQKRLKEET